jgi:uncharacterized OsmC-like protein
LMTTFLAIAENSRLDFKSFNCASTGKLEQQEGKLKMTEINLEPRVIIYREADREKTLKVLEKAEKVCLISNSITSIVTMKAEVEVAFEVTGQETPEVSKK